MFETSKNIHIIEKYYGMHSVWSEDIDYITQSYHHKRLLGFYQNFIIDAKYLAVHQPYTSLAFLKMHIVSFVR